MYRIEIEPKLLHFKEPAGTSRGVYTTRKVWYVHVRNEELYPGREGIGECAPLPDLSCDFGNEAAYEERLRSICRDVEQGKVSYDYLRDFPSVLCGLEMAFSQLKQNDVQIGGTLMSDSLMNNSQMSNSQMNNIPMRDRTMWNTPFARGEASLTINGLIWMGTYEEMRRRLEEKIKRHFRCIKLKIGAIDFEKELDLLARIRRDFPPSVVELRVDANGAFSPETALEKLQRLAEFHLHSIEQPIRARQWKQMAQLCRESPVPVALDEELIGVNELVKKEELLDTIRPQYIVLKPSLHGGLSGVEEWIREARKRNIGWWVTSALESNVGLTALALWCSSLSVHCPQGLGTGQLFTDNTPSHLNLEGDQLWYKPTIHSQLQNFMTEWKSSSPTVTVFTSGSTGTPKHLKADKLKMQHSARLTCSFLHLQPGDTALLCMPLKYIAGKMMVVRSLTCGLRLLTVEPSSHPLKDLTETPVFAAMTPMQVYATLQVPEEAEKLRAIRELIIGGGAIDNALQAQLKDFPHHVWSTYGMTETLSHIALRRLNGPEASDWYTPFNKVTVRLTDENTLAITAPGICDGELVTNDLAELDAGGRFRIIGRRDNVIDSGGIKIQIETVENKLRPLLHVPFVITARKDPKFGEVVTLLYESGHSESNSLGNSIGNSLGNSIGNPLGNSNGHFEENSIDSSVGNSSGNSRENSAGNREVLKEILAACRTLGRYERPRWITSVPALPLTGTGKPDRATARRLAADSKVNELDTAY